MLELVFRVVNLAARPQVNLRSVGRRRFAHLSDAGDEIHVDANIPWGSTTLFTLEFREESRYYAIHTSNNRYLSRDGRLVETVNPTCLFSLEYHAGNIALRDTTGLYLAPLGSKVPTALHSHSPIISVFLAHISYFETACVLVGIPWDYFYSFTFWYFNFVLGGFLDV